jgi:hypothetical protein
MDPFGVKVASGVAATTKPRALLDYRHLDARRRARRYTRPRRRSASARIWKYRPGGGRHYANWSSSALASCKTGVSNPSVNQP